MIVQTEKIDSGSLNLQAEKVVYSECLQLWREFKWEVWEKKVLILHKVAWICACFSCTVRLTRAESTIHFT